MDHWIVFIITFVICIFIFDLSEKAAQYKQSLKSIEILEDHIKRYEDQIIKYEAEIKQLLKER